MFLFPVISLLFWVSAFNVEILNICGGAHPKNSPKRAKGVELFFHGPGEK